MQIYQQSNNILTPRAVQIGIFSMVILITVIPKKPDFPNFPNGPDYFHSAY